MNLMKIKLLIKSYLFVPLLTTMFILEVCGQVNLDFEKGNLIGWNRQRNDGKNSLPVITPNISTQFNWANCTDSYTNKNLNITIRSPYSNSEKRFSKIGIDDFGNNESHVLEQSFIVNNGSYFYLNFKYRCILSSKRFADNPNSEQLASFRYIVRCGVRKLIDGFVTFDSDELNGSKTFNRRNKYKDCLGNTETAEIHFHNQWMTVSRVFSPSELIGSNEISIEFRCVDGVKNINTKEFSMAFIDISSGSGGYGGSGGVSYFNACNNSEFVFSKPTINKNVSYEWDYGNNTKGTSNKVTYTKPGRYNVFINVKTDNSSTNFSYLYAVVDVFNNLSGDFSFSGPDCGKDVKRTIKSSVLTSFPNESNWSWEVDDGLNPKKKYDKPIKEVTVDVKNYGKYSVVLSFPPTNVPGCKRQFTGFFVQKPCPLPCGDCITDFSPSAGEYVISAWVKQDGDITNLTTFSSPRIKITAPGLVKELIPKGEIIDGWQRIEEVINLANPEIIDIELISSSTASYFDDIRIFPFDGSMISYVYDPKTLRLVAELDERNYAKFYEYDEEGKLIRVKKETESGIRTIQETRENSAPNNK